MALPVPVVNTDPGPDYASNVNLCLGVIDSHNHSPGYGVPVTPSGLLINADLSFGINNATTLRSVRFSSQGSVISGASDLDCLYVVAKDLYYNDGSGNQVRITQSGAVAGSPGSISGLSSPASAAYSSSTSTFIFQSAANTPANIDGGSFIFRDITANSFGITMSAPASLAANYSLTLFPSLPGGRVAVTVDSSGNLGSGTFSAAQLTTQTVTQGLLAPISSGVTVSAGGIAISGSSGSFIATGGGGEGTVTNCAVTITTTGRPVILFLQATPPPTGGTSLFSVFTTASNGTYNLNVRFYNGSTLVGEDVLQFEAGLAIGGGCGQAYPAGSFYHVDMSINGTPGTYTYQLKYLLAGTTTTQFQCVNISLVAKEM